MFRIGKLVSGTMFLFTIIFMVFLLGNLVAQSTIYVDTSASGSNNGTNWTDAYTSFQTALDNAVSGDEIWVAKGTYRPSTEVGGTGNRFKTFQMKNGVEIYGGFAGTETEINQRANFGMGEANETILSGDLDGNDNFDVTNGGYQTTTGDDNSYHVFYHPSGINLDNSALLNGFTIYGGNANDNGGGMYNDGSSPTLEQIVIKENSAALGGGGIYNNNSSSPLILNSVFHSNISFNTGGGMDSWNSSNATLINCLFYLNNSYTGGALIIVNSSSCITNTSICHNTATSGGGLFCTFSGSSELDNCIIWGNEATNGNQIYLSSSAGEIILNYSCYSNSANDIKISGGTFTATNNNINSFPDFVSATTGDFRLVSNSPAVNTGLNSYNSQTNDIRGELRIQDGTIDMGAYEWTSDVDPQIIFVHAAASGSNNGSSWSDAFTDLQDALSASSSGDQIWVATGTYKPSVETGGTGIRYQTFQLKNGVSIYGGFAGTESAIGERTNLSSGETNETILSGDIGAIGDATDNCYHVIFNLGTGNNALLDGFTIKEGNASEGFTTAWGGGLYIDNVIITLQNITFESNYAVIGGGIILLNSTITLNNVVFKNNCATSGAGIYCASSTVNVNNGSFNNNDATNDGGAVYIYGASNITMNNSILWGNQASGDGNEICIDAGTVNLNYSSYSNNTGDIDNSGTFNPSNCITSNPLFVDTFTGDLRLYGNSPCVNSGSNIYNPLSIDVRGEDRIQNTTIDMGAYEWTAGTDPAYRVLYVNAIASGSNNGTSWTNAYTSLQSALNEAVSDDQIWVAKGTYKPSSAYDLTNTSRYYHFRLIEGVEIYGGFAGTETAVSQRANFGYGEVNETILSGDLNSNDDFDVTNGGYQGTTGDDNCYHVLYHPDGWNISNTSFLDGFTIKGGNANGVSNPHNRAGGLYVFSSSPTIQNVVFTSNSAASLGGAVYIYNSTSSFSNISCLNNVSNNAGAMYLYNANSVVSNAIFTGNISVTDGGALSTHSSSPIITNALFSSNNAGNNGGAIIFYSSTVPFNATLNNVTISDNHAGTSGGGIRYASNNAASVLNINNCIIWGNSAVTSGGNELSLVSIGSTTMNYSCYSNQTNDVEVQNGTLTATNNNITTDPSFVGSTENPNNPYSIGGISPCCDTGYNDYNLESYDIRGEDFSRKLDKSTGGSGTIDMGAYEYKLGTDPTLPVTLSTFTAQFIENTPTLYWSTESETDNMAWFVYRGDENNFTTSEKISEFIEGHGTTTQQQSYIYEDSIQKPEVGDTLYYWLESIDYSGQVNHYDKVAILKVHENDPGQGLIPVPVEYGLLQNRPNPVISSTNIAFNLQEAVQVDVKIYNLKGQLVKSLYSGISSSKILEWDGKDENGRELVSGIYFYNLIINGTTTETKKLLIVR